MSPAQLQGFKCDTDRVAILAKRDAAGGKAVWSANYDVRMVSQVCCFLHNPTCWVFGFPRFDRIVRGSPFPNLPPAARYPPDPLSTRGSCALKNVETLEIQPV